jgi:hypothetical protein
MTATKKRAPSSVVELHLTPEQEALLTPSVRVASARHRNVAFLATCAPYKDVWRFQVVEISPATGSKILKLIQQQGPPKD